MRCHAAEPGAVTSSVSVSQARRSWRTGGPSAVREDRCQGAERRGFTAGRKGERNTSPGSGCESTRPVGRTARYWQNTAVGAPVGEAARSQGPQAHPRTVSMLKVRHSALRSSFLWRDGEKDTKVPPRHRDNGVADYVENPCPTKAVIRAQRSHEVVRCRPGPRMNPGGEQVTWFPALASTARSAGMTTSVRESEET